MRRTRTTTTSRYQLARDVSLGCFSAKFPRRPSFLVPCPQEDDSLELEELWMEGCFLVEQCVVPKFPR